MQYTYEELNSILELHRKWLYGENDGKRANLRDANLSCANLSYANLSYANLRDANLRDANLSYANLSCANLRDANLSYADLSYADLSYANLRDANLRDAKNIPPLAQAQTVILPEGIIFGYNKAWSHDKPVIVKLLIPADAKRSNASGRKCRAEYADVISITSIDGSTRYENAISKNDGHYTVGRRIYPDGFDTDRWNECAPGIHFFITRDEAVSY